MQDNNQINNYLKYYENSWSPRTRRLVKGQLEKYYPLLKYTSSQLFDSLDHLGPYTKQQTLIRLAHFLKWAGDPSLSEWLKQNKNAFRNAYEFKRVNMTYDQAKEAISRISCTKCKRLAELMLESGLRVTELHSYQGTGTVIGKGGKTRPYFGSDYEAFNIHPNTLRNHLRKVGLKPHDLRKLCLTRLAERGAQVQDLCYVAGWSDIKTGYRYLQPSSDDRLKELLND